MNGEELKPSDVEPSSEAGQEISKKDANTNQEAQTIPVNDKPTSEIIEEVVTEAEIDRISEEELVSEAADYFRNSQPERIKVRRAAGQKITFRSAPLS